jgi:hypothetical protein
MITIWRASPETVRRLLAKHEAQNKRSDGCEPIAPRLLHVQNAEGILWLSPSLTLRGQRFASSNELLETAAGGGAQEIPHFGPGQASPDGRHVLSQPL